MAEYGAGIGIVPLTAAKRYKGALAVFVTDRWAKRQLVLCVRAATSCNGPISLMAKLAKAASHNAPIRADTNGTVTRTIRMTDAQNNMRFWGIKTSRSLRTLGSRSSIATDSGARLMK